MRTLLALAFVLSLVGLAPPTSAWDEPPCTASADHSARVVDAGPLGVHYVRKYSFANQDWVELWQESNGIDGLQPDASWTCGAPADVLLEKDCAGRGCPGVGI